ncbi:hypothetical protein L3X38_024984 [Prunus dulcis]|uniref:Reverse transcriptase domain-containing protein n=1 Tax=Prunus dulcis TaxID=3755 RepID=A0AAD4Z6X4_PRUDU|nr:hypothetical protein L3X38_024984 [Prunus dulcis]
MHEDDKVKTSFIIERGTYCYKVMPFGMKNTGATYQRVVNKIFKEQIFRTMEVYVDDMLVKVPQLADHVKNLVESIQPTMKIQHEVEPETPAGIIDYLVNENLPTNKSEARKVQQKAARYYMQDDKLIRRSYSDPYLTCIKYPQTLDARCKIDDGEYGNHSWGSVDQNSDKKKLNLDLLEGERERAIVRVASY